MRLDAIAVAVLVAAAGSCSPRHFRPELRDYNREARVDSVFVRDSVYIDRFTAIRQKNDTIYVTQVRTEYREKWRTREVHDTLYRDRTVTEVREVEKPLTKWQVFWMQLGKVAAGIICLLLLAILLKICKKFLPI